MAEVPVALLSDKASKDSANSQQVTQKDSNQPTLVQGNVQPPSLKNDDNLSRAEGKIGPSTNPAYANTGVMWSGYKTAESLATSGQPEMALRQLNARLANAPDDDKAAYLKGLVLMQLGRAEEAEKWFRMMQSNSPQLPQPYNALAVIYQGRGDWDSARAVLEELLKLQPNHHNARMNLAYIYTKLARDNYAAAEKLKSDAKVQKKIKTLDGML